MTYAQYRKDNPAAAKLRRLAGGYMRELRERAGLTQADVAEHFGYRWTTFVSQIERGISRVPPEQYHLWAKLYHVPVDELARTLLSFYDPFTYQALFGKPAWLDDPSADAGLAAELSQARAAPAH